jgi:hypothetical protein
VDWIRVRHYCGEEPTTILGDRNGSPTAVTLASFSAEPDETDIVITWQTTIEIDNVGFNLYRSDAANGPYSQLNEALIPSQAPGSMMGATYTWRDPDVTPDDTYFYKLEAIDVNGRYIYHGPVSAIPGTIPNAMRLQRLAVWHTYEAVILGMGALIVSIGLVFARRRRSHLS